MQYKWQHVAQMCSLHKREQRMQRWHVRESSQNAEHTFTSKHNCVQLMRSESQLKNKHMFQLRDGCRTRKKHLVGRFAIGFEVYGVHESDSSCVTVKQLQLTKTSSEPNCDLLCLNATTHREQLHIAVQESVLVTRMIWVRLNQNNRLFLHPPRQTNIRLIYT